MYFLSLGFKTVSFLHQDFGLKFESDYHFLNSVCYIPPVLGTRLLTSLNKNLAMKVACTFIYPTTYFTKQEVSYEG